MTSNRIVLPQFSAKALCLTTDWHMAMIKSWYSNYQCWAETSFYNSDNSSSGTEPDENDYHGGTDERKLHAQCSIPHNEISEYLFIHIHI